MRVLPAFRAAGWQPTGFGCCITCMFCQLLGLQVGNLQGLEAALLAYSVYFRAAGWHPSGFRGCIT